MMFLTLGCHKIIASLHLIAGVGHIQLAAHGITRHPFAVALQVRNESSDGLAVLDIRRRNCRQIGLSFVSQAEPHQRQ